MPVCRRRALLFRALGSSLLANPCALGADHPLRAPHAFPNEENQDAVQQRPQDWRHQHRCMQQVHVGVRRVDAGYHAQLLVHGREERRQPQVNDEEVDVYEGVPKAAAGLQLRLVVPLGPMPAVVLEEEAAPRPQVHREVARAELVGVEDEGRVEPGRDHEADGRPRPGKVAGVGARLGGPAKEEHEQGAREQQRAVVEGVHGVVQVEAADLLEPAAGGRGLADEGPALRGEAPARAHVGGPAVAELVHDVEADDLGLEDEEEPGAGEELPDEPREGGHQAPLHPDLGQERRAAGDEEEHEHHRKPHGQRLGHHLHGAPLRAVLEGLEAGLAVTRQHEEPGEDQDRHAPRHEELRDVVAHVRIEEGQEVWQVEKLAQPKHLARQDLLPGPRRKLREERENSVETKVTALGKVEVLTMADLAPTPSKGEVHARKDVFREVQGLRGLRDAPLLHHDVLVHDVRVAVVHSGPEHRVAALEDGAEGVLGGGGEVADGAYVAGDVLWEADDPLRAAVSAPARPELPQDAGKEEHLLEVAALVRIDALDEGAARKGQCVVLVVPLAVAEDWVAWELDAPLRDSPAVRQGGAGTVDEAAEVAPSLPPVHQIRLCVDVSVDAVDEGHLEALRELLQHLVGVP
mmetsp:Transcript_67012/g.195943  ORF Transcript_67012/g.195943 Transcript_67012/m.195943 type:complete len:634 (-) Transcript_67012:481-2382(-)